MSRLRSELLGPQQRVQQVDEQSRGDEAQDEVCGIHGAFHLQTRRDARVGDGERQEQEDEDDEGQVSHGCSSPAPLLAEGLRGRGRRGRGVLPPTAGRRGAW